MKAVRWTPARIRSPKLRAFSGCGAVYTQAKGFDLACSASFYLECDARPPAGSVAERVSALENRDLFRQTR